MSKTRDNHYVPQWYQKGFLSDGVGTLNYLNLSPDMKVLSDGREITLNAIQHKAPSGCFVQRDLYTTFFGALVNDEIERMLFGALDDYGARAIRAYTGGDPVQGHEQFRNLFVYIDAQKFRTPKGLDWIKSQYPSLNQNALMMEMQGIKNMHCTMWSEGVREIVSARSAKVKFLISDHPVTVYNYACPPSAAECVYPNDPDIALKASQTIFPLDRDHCLILTNFEYADDPEHTRPKDRRTFDRYFRQSMVRTDAFIRTRSLSDHDVQRINFVLKSRARQFIAAEDRDMLYPEIEVTEPWEELRSTLMPPEDQLLLVGGEMFAKFEDGSVYYQDAFGRTTPPNEHLQKNTDASSIRPNDKCGCGSEKKYKNCCHKIPQELRPSWSELSIQERNRALYNAIVDILGLNAGKSWDDIRRDFGDEEVRRLHEVIGAFWPPDTNLLSLLPKPDGKLRALYTGLIDPRTTPAAVANAAMYFGEVMVELPFLNPHQVRKEFSPAENPGQYKLETWKGVVLLMEMFELVKDGMITFIPDPCSLDSHLQIQMMRLAEQRGQPLEPTDGDIETFMDIQKEAMVRTLTMTSEDSQLRTIERLNPGLSDDEKKSVIDGLKQLQQADPLALLQNNVFERESGGGQMTMLTLAPNLEMSLYLAQATGAFLLTDSEFRWRELVSAQDRQLGVAFPKMPDLSEAISSTKHSYVVDHHECRSVFRSGQLGMYRKFAQSVLNELTNGREARSPDTLKMFRKAHANAERQLVSRGIERRAMDLSLLAPEGGIHHNNAHRLLIMSGSRYHLPTLPAAVFMKVHEAVNG